MADGFDVGKILATLGAVLDPRGFRDFDRQAAATERRAAALERSVNSRRLAPKVSFANDVRAQSKRATSDALSALGAIGSRAGRVAATMGKVFGAVGVVAGGAAAYVGIKFDVLMQRAQIGFTTLLGSTQKARQMLGELQRFAATTPFEFADLVPQAQRMLAMGISARKIIPDLRAVGDAEALLGGGKEGIDRVVTALGQMQAKSKVSAEEMRQLAEAGIPAWKFLADAVHMSVADTMKAVQDGKIAGATGVDAIVAGMQRKFGGGMAKISKTLEGQWSNLMDNLQRLAGELVMPAMPFLTRAVGALQREVGRLLSAKSFHVRAAIVWDDVQGAASSLWSSLGSAINGSPGARPRPSGDVAHTSAISSISGGITVPDAMQGSGAADGLRQSIEKVDWRSIGGKVMDGIAAGAAAAGDKWGQVVNAIAAALEANAPALSAAAVVLAGNIVTTLTDPGFWADHWRLALGVAIAVFPVGRLGKVGEIIGQVFGRFGGVIGSALGSAFLEAIVALERVAPRAASVVFRSLLVAFRILRTLGGGILEGLWGAVSGAFSALGGRAGPLLRTVFRLIIVTGILGAVSAAASAAANLGSKIISSVTGALSNVGHAVSAKIRQVGNGIISGGAKALTDAVTLGGRIVSSITSGIGDVGGRIASWISSHLGGHSISIPFHVKMGGPGGIVPVGISWAQGGSRDGSIFESVGGRVRKPALLSIGEEAPTHEEYVIPTNPTYRQRALGLLGEAAAKLGVGIAGAARGDTLTRMIRRASRLHGKAGREGQILADEDRTYAQDSRAFDLSVEDLTKPAGVAKRRAEISTLIGEKQRMLLHLARQRNAARSETRLERAIAQRARRNLRAAKTDKEREKWRAVLDASAQRLGDLGSLVHDYPFARRDLILDIRELQGNRSGTILDTSGAAAAGGADTGTVATDPNAANIAERAAQDAGLAARTAAITASISGALAAGTYDQRAGVGAPAVHVHFESLVPPSDPGTMSRIARGVAAALDATTAGMAGGVGMAG